MVLQAALDKQSLTATVNMVKTIWANQLDRLATTSTRKKALLLTLGATVALVARLAFRLLYVPRSLRHIPSVNWFAYAGSVVKNEDGASRARNVFGKAMVKGNGVFLACFPVNWTLYVAEPVIAKAVLMQKDKFPKILQLLSAASEDSPSVKYFGYTNVGFLNGEDWKRQRRVMNPAFHSAMPINLFGTLMQRSYKIIDEQDHTVPILDLFQRMTLDAIGIAGFGFDFGAVDDRNSKWTSTYKIIRAGFKDPLVFMFPRLDWLLKHIVPGRRQLDDAIEKLNGLLMDIARRKREQLAVAVDTTTPVHEKDLLTLMLEAELRGEGTTSDEELRSNLALFFMAGHETTANAMSFCFYNLAIHQDIQDKAREEALSILGDGPEDILPTMDHLRQISYIDMVLKENLRQFPPASALFPRCSKEDTVLNGLFIPKNTPIIIELDAMHNNPQIWKNPEVFDPERFAPGGENQTNFQGSAWLPFSSGTRVCIGQNFSLVQQRTFLAMLLRKYTWRLPDDSIHKHGLKMGSFQNIPPESLIIEFQPRH